MLTVIVTGGIGSGKSAVCALLRKRGIPVYDSDSRVKELYACRRSLVPRLEKALGCPLRKADGTLDKARLAALIFSDKAAREILESIVYPVLLKDFLSWRSRQKALFVVLESAVILSKPVFDGLADAVVLVDAPAPVRISRVMRRDALPEGEVRRRMAAQPAVSPAEVQAVIQNDGAPQALSQAVERTFFHKNSYLCKLLNINGTPMKTDLAKTLSVRGQHGLFNYIAQSRTGAIAESLEDKKRYNFNANAGITTLADISIYTEDAEMKLQEVFGKMHEVLGEELAPSAKADPEQIKALFAKAVPNYDGNRFYVSHMKKVVEWYNILARYASLDFLTDEEREAEAAAEEKAE